MNELYDLINEVKDEETFLAFVNALITDHKLYKGIHLDEVGFAGTWANSTIDGFLEPAVAWAENSEFGTRQDGLLKQNSWKQFAQFLYCGKIYE